MNLRIHIFAAPLMAVMLAACAGAPDRSVAMQNPLTVTESVQRHVLMLGAPFDSYVETRDGPLAYYLDGYLSQGSGILTIEAAPSLFESDAGQRLLGAAQEHLFGAGLLTNQIQWRARPGAPTDRLTLSHILYRAEAPACARPDTIGHRSLMNATPENFGCAQQRNLAAMAADRGDLVRMRPMDAADGTRAARIINLWRQGRATESERGQVRQPSTTLNIGR